MKKRLVKSNDRILSGVCGGIADYMGVDPAVMRLIFIFGFAVGGSFGLAYLILLFIMPNS